MSNSEVDNELYHANLALIGAIFRLASQDFKYGKKEEVLNFIDSEWFIFLCDSINLEFKEVARLICTSSVKQRMEYH